MQMYLDIILPMEEEPSECMFWLFGLLFGIPQVGRCGAGIVDELFLRLICLELPDTLDALEVEEATELEEDILDNVESVDTGDIVDVLPNPPAPTPPGTNRKMWLTVLYTNKRKNKSNLWYTHN